MKLTKLLVCSILIFLNGCKSNDEMEIELNPCGTIGLLENFTTSNGQNVFIYEDGQGFIENDGICSFALQYFDPNFIQNNYVTNDSGTFIIANTGELFPIKNNFIEDFENYSTLTDLIIQSASDTALYWNAFTLQSPAAPTVADYNALRFCILDGTCTFIDNKIELVADPTDASNQVIKFTSVAPNAEMVTAKSSIQSTINYYDNGSEVWFQASFYIESGIPFSLVDFENSYFEESPGPRVIIRDNKIEFENKFGAKLNFDNTTGVVINQNEWFTLKVHLKYSNESDGIIEIWQDGIPIISTTGINLPTSNSIQNVVELGISATPMESVLLIDNMRISETPF